jgi:hypothetical protein
MQPAQACDVRIETPVQPREINTQNQTLVVDVVGYQLERFKDIPLKYSIAADVGH